MKIVEIKKRDRKTLNNLLILWENSVRSTHTFLEEDDIKRIKSYVPLALSSVQHLFVSYSDNGKITAFIGIEDKRIEMLFVSTEERNKKIGSTLIKFVTNNYHVNEVTVNEQNIMAVGFYEHIGFKTYKRSDTDEEGNPFPLLYMKLA